MAHTQSAVVISFESMQHSSNVQFLLLLFLLYYIIMFYFRYSLCRSSVRSRPPVLVISCRLFRHTYKYKMIANDYIDVCTGITLVWMAVGIVVRRAIAIERSIEMEKSVLFWFPWYDMCVCVWRMHYFAFCMSFQSARNVNTLNFTIRLRQYIHWFALFTARSDSIPLPFSTLISLTSFLFPSFLLPFPLAPISAAASEIRFPRVSSS